MSDKKKKTLEEIKNFPQYLPAKKKTVSVEGYIKNDNKNYTDNKGYIDDDGVIWIFNATGKPKNPNMYPYFWFTEDGKLEFSNPDAIMINMFRIERLVDMSLVNIINNTAENEVLFDEEEISNIISSTSFYVPEIKEDEDFLKKLVKYTILQKGIDINKLKSKTDEKYILPNMKAALNNKTKMSVVYFAYWMDLLGCDFEVTIMDNGTDKRDSLKNPILYQSHTEKLNNIVNGIPKEAVIAMKEKEDDE